MTAATTKAAGRASAAEAERDLGDPLPLRVGFTDRRGRAIFGKGVEVVELRGDRPKLERVDLLVSGPGEEATGSLLEAARSRGLPVISLVEDYEAVREPADLEPPPERARRAGAAVAQADAEPTSGASFRIGAVRRGERSLPAAPPLDPSRFNPTGFRPVDVAGYQASVQPGARDVAAAMPLLREIARDDPIAVLAPPDAELPELPGGARRSHHRRPLTIPEAVDQAQSRIGVLDHPGLHASEWQRAGWLAKLCAAGVPVIAAEISAELAELLGAELTELLSALSPPLLADLDRRERLSIALRRTALREHSFEARWRQIAGLAGLGLPPRPMVSVIFATRRQEWLAHGLLQVARQSYRPLELVVCLHGNGFSADVEEQVRAHAGAVETKVVRVGAELNLGDTLNAGIAASAGALITKMDDDDWYNADHLWDLVLALEYAGADLTGKGAEFCYLEGVDLTIRRFKGDGESEHPRLAGGSIMGRRGPLEAIGGWPSRSRGEDTWVVKNMKSSGRKSYRTHGFGYILNRHGRDHTWNTYVDYFLVQSQREYRGLRLDETAIEADAERGLRPG